MDTKVVIQPQDMRFMKTDPNFDPERNKRVINETIKETTKFFKEMGELKDKESKNRIGILSWYADYRFKRGDKDFKGYVGKKLYNELIGEKILAKVRVMDSVNRLNNNTGKFKKSILL